MRLSKKLVRKVHRNKIVVVNALKMTYVNRGIVRIGANLLLRLAKIQPSKEGVCSMKCLALPQVFPRVEGARMKQPQCFFGVRVGA